MAVKKTLIGAIPYSEDGKVTRWNISMKYEDGTEGQADYYASEFEVMTDAEELGPVDSDGKPTTTTNFTPKAEGEWTKKELEDLCPTAKWDDVFASQYDSVITNPPKSPEPNNGFVLPS